MNSENNQTERINQLEAMMTHLQNDFDQLNSVVLDLHKELQKMNARLEHLDGRVTILSEEPEIRNPEEEKPPHY